MVIEYKHIHRVFSHLMLRAALSPEIWDFEAFVRDKLAYWIDEATGANEEEYAEVDALREELSQDMRGPSSRVTP